MSWRPLAPQSAELFDEEQSLDVLDETWLFRRLGKQTFARLGSGPFAELPRLTKLEGFFAEPDLALAGTTHLVASPPSTYLARGAAPLGIDDVTCGTYDLTWYDLDNARAWELEEEVLDGGEETFQPPEPIDGRAALFLRRTSL